MALREPLIVRRLDAAIARADALGAKVLAVNLTAADRKLLTRWATHRWRRSTGSSAIAHPCSFRDHPIRFGKKTTIFTAHGVCVAVPRRA